MRNWRSLAALLALSLCLSAQTLPFQHRTQLATSSLGFSTLGAHIEPLDDINADGIPDYAVRESVVFGISTSLYHLISGADGSLIRSAAGVTNTAVRLRDVGDLTGDGVRDHAIVIMTGASGLPTLSLENGATGAVVWSATASPEPALSGVVHDDLVGLSDLDADGVRDLAVLITGNAVAFGGPNRPTRIRWFSGATGALMHEIIDELLIIRSIANAGDSNGDGFDDLLIAAPTSPFVAPNAGGASLVSGADFSYLHFWNGNAANNFFASGVAGAGDVNGDGFDDILISSAPDDAVYLYSGQDASLLQVFSMNAGGTSALSIVPSATFDWNGDGTADRILRDSSTLQVRSGVDFAVLHVASSTTEVLADVNGDGLPELASQDLTSPSPQIRVESHKGAEVYGLGSGGLVLDWLPDPIAPALGTFWLSGGTPLATVLIGGSTAPLNATIFGTSFPLLISPAPADLFLQLTTTLDGFGQLGAPVSLSQPVLAGTVLSYQWAEIAPNPGTSNGLQLMFDL